MFSDLFGPMAPETSTYQAFKLWIDGYVPFGRNEIHVMLGAALLILARLVWRDWRRAAWIAFGVSLVLGIGMEMLDRRDDIALYGAWRVWASVGDVIRTIGVPALALVILGLRRPRRKAGAG